MEHMLISGLTDSIGLYVQPGDAQRALAASWLRMLGMESQKDTLFCDLTAGEQRLVFCARAMIKHPPLLILDEPTAGLDTQAASLVVGLIRKMAEESRTALVFVSHRDEPGLRPGLDAADDGGAVVAVPGEEGDREFLLEQPDLPAERGLSDVQPFGRPAEAAGLGDGEEGAELL